MGVWIFDAKISTMLHISVYIFLLMLAMWLFIDYEEMKSRQSIQKTIREEEEKQQRMKEEKQRTIRQLEQKYGHCSYVMAPYKKPNATDLVRIYPEARMMVIQGKEYSYDEILSYRISERDVNDTAMETHTVTTTHYTYHPITRTKYSVVISTTRSPHDITIFMNEDYNRALRLMKQINTARYN